MVTCGIDKTIKFWDLTKFKLVSSSKPDNMYYQKIIFNESGENIYAFNSDSVKVYNMEKDALCLDSVES